MPKNAVNFSCASCDFECFKKSNYDAHLLTRKHKILTNTDVLTDAKNAAPFQCVCGKIYKHRQSIFNHKQKCRENNTRELEKYMKDQTLDAGLVCQLIQQNKEMQTQILNLTNEVKEMSINNVNNTQNNFNINVFLNETCKDAINFTEFIDKIEVSHEDLENNAQLGFVNGITKIITDNLKQYTICERPIHCTDVKRDKMYIKDENIWLREQEKVKEVLNKAIQEVSRKSMCSLIDWRKSNPDYADMDSEFSKKCIVMQKESIAGENRDKFYPKIMGKVGSSVQIKNQSVLK